MNTKAPKKEELRVGAKERSKSEVKTTNAQNEEVKKVIKKSAIRKKPTRKPSTEKENTVFWSSPT